jgi:prefoldin subunit 5
MYLKRAALLSLVLVLVAIPAAQARTYTVDGRVTSAPSIRGGAVTVPVLLTKKSGRAIKVGTRRVRVRLARRSRLPLAGASSARLAPSALRAGDRLKGKTALSKKARRRLRRRARPTLKVNRASVTRGGGGGGSVTPAPALRTFEQIVAELGTQAASLFGRVGELGSLPQRIEAQKLQLETLKTNLETVATAFEGLEARGIPPEMFEPLVARVEALETSLSAVEDALGTIESGLGKVEGALETIAPAAAILASQASLIRSIPGAEAQVVALDEALRALGGKLDAIDAALGALDAKVAAANAAISALTNAVNGVTDAGGVAGLSGPVGNLEAAFGGLASSITGIAPTVASLEADGVEAMAEMLCTVVPTACP